MNDLHDALCYVHYVVHLPLQIAVSSTLIKHSIHIGIYQSMQLPGLLNRVCKAGLIKEDSY